MVSIISFASFRFQFPSKYNVIEITETETVKCNSLDKILSGVCGQRPQSKDCNPYGTRTT